MTAESVASLGKLNKYVLYRSFTMKFVTILRNPAFIHHKRALLSVNQKYTALRKCGCELSVFFVLTSVEVVIFQRNCTSDSDENMFIFY